MDMNENSYYVYFGGTSDFPALVTVAATQVQCAVNPPRDRSIDGIFPWLAALSVNSFFDIPIVLDGILLNVCHIKITQTTTAIAMAESGLFDQPDDIRKLGLDVEGKKFWVSREALALQSPVFETMLYGDFAEAKRDSIELPGKKADDIEELLLCWVSPRGLKKVSFKNLELLLNLADEYEIEAIRMRAGDFMHVELATCGKADEKLLCILRCCTKFRVKELLLLAITRCAEEFSFEKLKPLLQELSVESAAALLCAREGPANGKCHSYTYYYALSGVRCNSNSHNCLPSSHFVKCKRCFKTYCGKCLENGTLYNIKCSANSNVESSIQAFLDRV